MFYLLTQCITFHVWLACFTSARSEVPIKNVLHLSILWLLKHGIVKQPFERRSENY